MNRISVDKKKKLLSSKKRDKLTEVDRHARFVEAARKVEASEDPKDFDKAFKAVTSGKKR